MKIGIISHLKYAICEPFAGGLEMHTHLLASSLNARGHAVTLFAAQGSCQENGLVALCPPTGANSAASERHEHDAYGRLMDGLAGSDMDIVHNNSLHYLPLARAGSLPMPMVTTLHTPPFATLADAARRISLHDHRFIAISKTTATQWSAILAVDQIISNGIDLLHFRFCPQQAATPYWVWHGRIVPEKGLHIAIEAACQAGVALRFAGPIADPAYFATAIAPRLSAGISYSGHLSHRELAVLIGGARVCLCTPRWEEPFGLVIAEALACGTPVAGFRRGALPELIDRSCGVLIEGENPAHLAAAAFAAQRLDRTACRARAVLNWDAGRMVAQYEAVYAALVDRNIRRAA